jgi:multicomponent Na+:H+ antiporter subunit B
MFAFGETAMRKVLMINPRTLSGIGLVVAVFSGFLPALAQLPAFTGLWFDLTTPIGSTKLGTPILFDVGVYMTVLGVCVSLMEDLHQE